MEIRKLLICTEPRNEIEASLKRMYLKRVQERVTFAGTELWTITYQ